VKRAIKRVIAHVGVDDFHAVAFDVSHVCLISSAPLFKSERILAMRSFASFDK
jgi:hypothetical protein